MTDVSGSPPDGTADLSIADSIHDVPFPHADGNDGLTGTCASRLAPTATFALCEPFVAPAGDGGRTGDLDPTLWAVARRSGFAGAGFVNLWPTAQLVGCGSPAPALPPADVRVCGGRMHEASNDNGTMTVLSFTLLQPFDWAERTGTIVFDVSADSAGLLGAYPALSISERLEPTSVGLLDIGQPPTIRNGLWISLAPSRCHNDSSKTGVDQMIVVREYAGEPLSGALTGCVAKGDAVSALNHFELRLSSTRVEVWGTDPGSSTMVQLALADGVELPMTRGFVSFQDVHFSPFKGADPSQENHTFSWDNIGFDGPVLPRYVSSNVPDGTAPGRTPSGAPGTHRGYAVEAAGLALETAAVSSSLPPAEALLAFDWYALDDSVPSVRINGGSWIDSPWLGDATAFCWRSIVIPIPPTAVVQGKNTVDFRAQEVPGGPVVISNTTLLLAPQASPP